MSIQLVTKRFMSSGLKRWAYNLSGFNKYGLWRDDLRADDNPLVQEALRRVPQHIVDERNYRILRAVQLSIQKDILPKNQWTKLEDDVLYLTPHIQQVEKEQQERMEWEKNY